MAEYIERQAAIDLFYPVDPENDGSDGCTVVYKTENYTSDEIEAVISGLPAADVAPVRHGKWKPVKYNACCSCGKSYGTYHFLCSACNHIAYSQPYRLTYCPNCGARMDKEDNKQ